MNAAVQNGGTTPFDAKLDCAEFHKQVKSNEMIRSVSGCYVGCALVREAGDDAGDGNSGSGPETNDFTAGNMQRAATRAGARTWENNSMTVLPSAS